MASNYSYGAFRQLADQLREIIIKYNTSLLELNKIERENAQIQRLSAGISEKYGAKYGRVTGIEQRYSAEDLKKFRTQLLSSDQYTIARLARNQNSYINLMGIILSVLNAPDYEELKRKEQESLHRLKEIAGQYESSYKRVLADAGCLSEEDWKKYEPARELKGNLYLGDLERSFTSYTGESGTSHINKLLTQLMPFSFCDGIVRIPFTQPITDPIGLLYDYNKKFGTQAVQATKSLVYQMVRKMPDFYLQIHLMDGENKARDFQAMRDLEIVKDANRIELNRKVTNGNYKLVQVYDDDAQITKGLQTLDSYMSKVSLEMGSSYKSLAEYNAVNADTESGRGIIPYQAVVIQNFPTGFNDSDIVLLDRLIRNGAQLGISVFLLNNQDTWTNPVYNNHSINKAQYLQDKISQESLLFLDTISMEIDGDEKSNIGTGSGSDENGNITLMAERNHENISSPFRPQLLETERNEFIQDIVTKKTTRVEKDNSFQNVFTNWAEFRQMDATQNIQIPFALDDRGKIMEYCLGGDMNAHGLISGGTGSGKSSLLHMLVSSIVMNYSPQDVEIWLVDYKITEFYSYKTNTPPHIRFIGLSKTEDFSYAFIDKVTEEMNRRQNIIAMADYQLKQLGEPINITNFVDYRKNYKKISGENMRRLVIIIDEFHVMAQHAQLIVEYKQKLENLLAEARAMGISMLFSDQAITVGLQGLSDKGKKQMRARIALSNYEDELKEILNEKDREKIKPYLNMNKGEVAMQTSAEERDEDGALVEVTQIQRGMAIYIDSNGRYKVCQRAREIYKAMDHVPDFFDDREIESVNWREIKKWEEIYLPAHRDGRKDFQIHVGRPVNLQLSMHFPLLQRKGNNIMSVSGTEEQQMRIIMSVLESFQRQSDYEILIFADRYAGVYREYYPEFESIAAQNRRLTIYDDISQICYQINRILSRVNDRGNEKKTLVLWIGLDSLADVFAEEKGKKPDVLTELAEGRQFSNRENKKNSSKAETIEKTSSDLDKLSDSFALLFGNDESLEENVAEEAELKLDDDTDYLYNACDDIVRIVHVGPSRNVFNMVVYDSAAALKDFRKVGVSDFNHRIAFTMSENDASAFLDRSSLIRSLPDSMAYYYNGKTGGKFMPYKL